MILRITVGHLILAEHDDLLLHRDLGQLDGVAR